METRNDSDLLPLLLTGVAVLIMGTAVAMYSNDSSQSGGQPQSTATVADDPSPAPPASLQTAPQPRQ